MVPAAAVQVGQTGRANQEVAALLEGMGPQQVEAEAQAAAVRPLVKLLRMVHLVRVAQRKMGRPVVLGAPLILGDQVLTDLAAAAVSMVVALSPSADLAAMA